jgi:hypothetical protein
MKILNTISIILFFFVSVCSASVSDSLKSIDSVSPKPMSLSELRLHLSQISQNNLLTNVEVDPDPLRSAIDYNKLMLFGGASLAVGVTVHIYQSNAWWQTQDSKFRFVNDWEYALWIDKTGHFFGTHLIGHAFSGAYEAANFQPEESAILSSISALAFELFIEIEDGFGPDWGFSPGDAMADVFGAGFYLAQYYYPFLKNFQPRVSYIPTKEFRNGTHKSGIIIDDYEGQKYWMGIRMKEVLPDKLADYWPSFLMVSLGMGVSDLDGSGGGTRSFYAALDFDAEQIPLYGGVWQFIKNTLNYIHFPMPGVRITPNTAFFGIVF